MTTSLVERLRDMAGKKYNHTWAAWVQQQCKEAADRIEELESALSAQQNAPQNHLVAADASLPSEQHGLSVAKLPFAILPDEMAALERFHECAMDGEGYDVSKEMMQRLAEIGLVRRRSGNYYEHTTFGLAVLNGEFKEASCL